MSRPEPGLPKYLEDKKQLHPNTRFPFTCHPGVPCFNSCCADVNIIMTPLDVLGLARRLEMHTRDFLETYTGNPITKELQLPMVILKMRDEEQKRCHFVGDEGCTVYEDRPWACRMYPLGMAIPPARAGEEPEPVYFLFEDDHCEGRHQSDCKMWTPNEWRQDQAIAERDEIEKGFRELVSHPWFIGGRQLDPKRLHMFYTACYDLDSFRSFVFESSFLERFELEDELAEELRNNDLALLQFAFRWLRFALFGEPTMRVRDAAAAGSDR
jgi:Fe-S-cluster containining protein